jgi:hypothetical protein
MRRDDAVMIEHMVSTATMGSAHLHAVRRVIASTTSLASFAFAASIAAAAPPSRDLLRPPALPNLAAIMSKLHWKSAAFKTRLQNC